MSPCAGAPWTLVPAKHYGNSTAVAGTRQESFHSSALLDLLARARRDRHGQSPGNANGEDRTGSGRGDPPLQNSSRASVHIGTRRSSLYDGLMRGRSSSSGGGGTSDGANTTAPSVLLYEGLHVRGVKATGGIYAGLLRGGSMFAGNGGSSGVGGSKPGSLEPANASASLPAASEGTGRLVLRIPEGVDAQYAGKGCAAGCEKRGTCDRELGVCRCAISLHIPDLTASPVDISTIQCLCEARARSLSSPVKLNCLMQGCMTLHMHVLRFI